MREPATTYAPALTYPGEPGVPDEPEPDEPFEPSQPGGPERSPAPWHDPGPPVRRVNLPPDTPSPGIPIEEPGRSWPTEPGGAASPGR